MLDLAHEHLFLSEHTKTNASKAEASITQQHNVFQIQNRPRILQLYGKNLLRIKNDSQKTSAKNPSKISTSLQEYSVQHNYDHSYASCSSEDSLLNTIVQDNSRLLRPSREHANTVCGPNSCDSEDVNDCRRPHSVDVLNRLSLSVNTSGGSISYFYPRVSDSNTTNNPQQSLQSCNSVPCVLAQVDTSGSAFHRYCLYRRSLSGIQYEQTVHAQRRTRSVSKHTLNSRQHSASPLVAKAANLMTKSDYNLPCGLSVGEFGEPDDPQWQPADSDNIPTCMTASDYGPLMMTRSETDETITGDVTPTSTTRQLPSQDSKINLQSNIAGRPKSSIPCNLALSNERTKSSSLYIKSSNSSTRLPKNRYSLYLGSESYIHSSQISRPPNSSSNSLRTLNNSSNSCVPKTQKFATVKRSNSVPVKSDSSIIVKMDIKKNEIQAISTEDYEKERLCKDRTSNKSLRNRTMSFFKPRSSRTRSFDPTSTKLDDKPQNTNCKRSKSPFFRLFSGGHTVSNDSSSGPTEDEDSSRTNKGGTSLKVVMRRKSRSRDKKSESYQPQTDKHTSLGNFLRHNSKSRFSQNDVINVEETFFQNFRDSNLPNCLQSQYQTSPVKCQDYVSNLSRLVSLLEQHASYGQDLIEATISLSKLKTWLKTGKDKLKAKHRRLFDRYPADTQPASYSKVLCGLTSSSSPVQENSQTIKLEDSSTKLTRPDSLHEKNRANAIMGLSRVSLQDSNEALSRSTAERLDILSNQFTAAVSLRRAYKDSRLKIERRTSSGHWTMSTASIRPHGSSSPHSVRSLSVGPSQPTKSVPPGNQQVKEINKMGQCLESDRSAFQRSSTLSTDSAVMSASVHSSLTTCSYRTNSLITPLSSDTFSISSHPDDTSQVSNQLYSRPSSIVDTTPLVQMRRPKLSQEPHALSNNSQKCSTETLKAGSRLSAHTAPTPPPRSVSLRQSKGEVASPTFHDASFASSPSSCRSGKPIIPPPNTPQLSTPLQDYQSWCKRLPYKNNICLTQSVKRSTSRDSTIDNMNNGYVSPRDLRKTESWDSNRKRCSLSMPMNAEKELDKMLCEISTDPRPKTLYLCRTDVSPNDVDNKLLTESTIECTTFANQIYSDSSPLSNNSHAQTPNNSMDILKSMTSTKMSISFCEGNGSLSSLQTNLDSPSLGQYSRLYSLRGLYDSRNLTSPKSAASPPRNKPRPQPTTYCLKTKTFPQEDSSPSSPQSQSPSPTSSQILPRRRHTAVSMYSSMHSDAFSRSQRLLSEMKERQSKRNSMPIDENAVVAVLNSIRKQSSLSPSAQTLDQPDNC